FRDVLPIIIQPRSAKNTGHNPPPELFQCQKTDREDLRVGGQRATGGLNLDEVAGAHPKSAPDLVLFTGACQARLARKDEQITAVSLNLIKNRWVARATLLLRRTKPP